MKRVQRCLLSLAFAALLCPPAAAQSSMAGAIGGSARDPHQAVVASATVRLWNSEIGEQIFTHTNSEGRFRFANLKPGLYTLIADGDGFSQVRLLRIRVEVGRLTEVSIAFALAGGKESVEVRDEAPALNRRQPDFASNLDDAAIENLPINGRRWSNFALLTPTVTMDGNYGLISFRGISGTANNITLDGADSNQAFLGQERGGTRISYMVSQASIREFQVNTANYSAEYGGAAGAVVNSVTRSGGRHTRGELFYFDRDNTWGASNAFTQVPVQLTTNNITDWGTEQIKPLDRRQQFGGTLGGPLIKDKLFYFLSGDGQQRDFPAVAAARNTARFLGRPCVTQKHLNQIAQAFPADLSAVQVCSYDELYTLQYVMPITSTDDDRIQTFNAGLKYLAGMLGPVPRTATHDIIFAKTDYRLDSRKLLSLSMNRMRWSSPRGTNSDVVVNYGVDSTGMDGVKADTFIARLALVLGAHTAAELRYSLSRDFEYQKAQAAGNGEPANGNGLAPEISVASGSGFAFGTPYTLSRKAFPDEYRNQLAASLSWLRGRHMLKFGADLSHVSDEMSDLLDGNGSYSYSRRDRFIADLCQWQKGPLAAQFCNSRFGLGNNYYRGYSSFRLGSGQSDFQFQSDQVALFAQDEWRPLSRLTLDLGLRYERLVLPSPQVPNKLLPATSQFPSGGNNFGPRIGFALELGRDAKTVLRGGYGIFYGRIVTSTIAAAVSETGAAGAQLDYSYCYKANKNCSMQGPLFPSIGAPRPGAGEGGNVVVFDPKMKLPLIHQVDLIVERQVARNTVLSASFLLSVGYNLPDYVDTNLDPASRINVTYSFQPDYINGTPGPYNGQQLQMPVYTKRLNQQFDAISQIRSSVNSTYSAAVVQFNRTLRAGLDFRLNYTWAHALDNGQSSTTFAAQNNTLSPDPFTYTLNGVSHTVTRPDYGNSNYDIRQQLTGSLYVTSRPIRGTSGFIHEAMQRWTMAPVVHLSTGRPYSDSVSGEPTVTVPGIPAFSSCPGCLGLLGAGGGQYRLPFLERNSFRYGNFYNVDLRLSRRFLFHERRELEVLAEGFNLLNHQNITGRYTTMYSIYTPSGAAANTGELDYESNFGRPTSSASSIYRERELQLGARLHF